MIAACKTQGEVYLYWRVAGIHGHVLFTAAERVAMERKIESLSR